MMPSGLTPRRLRPETRVCRSGPSSTATRASGRLASMAVNGSTAVSPLEKGSGCTTRGASVMRTVSVPWLMATREILTSLPMTMVPVRSSMTTRAGVSDSTTRFSISA